jgi:hypothetical protein
MRPGDADRAMPRPPVAEGTHRDERAAGPAPATTGVLWRGWAQAVRGIGAARGPLARVRCPPTRRAV